MNETISSSLSKSSHYCFDPAQFGHECFEPAGFVAATKEITSLEVLRDHLRGYQRDLREELYEVINRDLADYLHLSSKLSGIESEAMEIRVPLQEFSSNLQETQEFVVSRKEGVQNKLHERADLKLRRDTLEKRLLFLGALRDLEIMLCTPGVEWDMRKKRGGVAPLREIGETTSLGPLSLTTHCQAFERAAYAWLSLTIDKACFPQVEGSEDVPTAAAIGLRLQRAEKALLNKLSAVLRTVICPKNLVISLASSDQPAEDDVQVNAPALRHCLRAFMVLGRGDEAEKQTARLLMLPFIDLNFTQGRLDGGSRGSCSGLKAIYSATLAHVKHNISQVLAIAEDCHGISPLATIAATTPSISQVPLDLVCNGVWRPIHQALSARLASIFAPGIASILHKNYVISMQFLDDLAGIAGPSHQASVKQRLMAHSSIRDFKSRWNLPVYFHLRFTEISAMIDLALKRAGENPDDADSEGKTKELTEKPDELLIGRVTDETMPAFTRPVFKSMWRAATLLWQSDVFLPPLTQRLFKLMLQIFGRFYRWLEEAFEGMEKGRVGAGEFLRADAPDSLVTVAWDILLFSKEDAVLSLLTKVLSALNIQQKAAASEIQQLVREGLQEATTPYNALILRAWDALHRHVVGQCATTLQAVRGITATYRMTNKRPPERASPFVIKILDPLYVIEPDMAGKTPPSLANVWKGKVMSSVTERYLEVTRELLASVEQMEDALKKRKQRAKASMQSSSSSTVDATAALSDSDKIKLQLLLDVGAFSQEMSTVGGIDPFMECPPYNDLVKIVASASIFLERSDINVTLPASFESYLKDTTTMAS